MDIMFANLHLHSTYSDAGFTPEQLVRIGKALGYKALALTDHDTDGGCAEFMENCRIEGIEFITGAEFYGEHNGRKMHLTALDFDPQAPSIRFFIGERCRLQAQWTKACFDLAKDMGLVDEITWDEVVQSAGKGAWLCYDSVLNLLSQKHLLTPERTEAIKAVRSQEQMQALKPEYPRSVDVIRAVRDAGGVIALAHAKETQFDFIEQLVDLGLNGIEVNHPSMLPEAIALAEELASRRGLYRCGGTDHTGPMGGNGGKYAIPVFNGISEEDYRILTERRLG